ncbi:MAG TPA: TonB-dependent receptor [Sphingobium sp.]|nr:TonB-dependent receptor [Sphingobium sp.]
MLKGPQGTLFGNNSTGGAINYVAKKPTDSFEAGGSFTYGRFNRTDLTAYVSGPITDTLSMRLAVQHQGGSDWQKSATRDETNGRVDFTNARLTAQWKPTDRLTALLTVNRWFDHSDFTQPQAISIFNPTAPGLATYPAGPRGNRIADWNPGYDNSKDNRYLSITGRLDYELSDVVTLTSMTTYIDYRHYVPGGVDGVPTNSFQFNNRATSKSFAQELRATAKLDRLNLILGGNYERDNTNENPFGDLSDSGVAAAFAGLTGTPWNTVQYFSRQIFKNYAFFGNAEFELTPELTLQGGLRYTKADVDFAGCTADTGDGSGAAAFTSFINIVRGAVGLPAIAPIAPNGCITVDQATLQPAFVRSSLNQDNLSWRAGVQFKPSNSLLLYANLSKGYKGGSYPLAAATVVTGLNPATQESVLAYEGGFKAGLFDRAVQLNGAVFFNDYRGKQVTGVFVDPVVGPINLLVNVPKARIYGAELELSSSPIQGLTLNVAGSYIRSDILGHYSNADATGATRDFHHTDLPFVPRWQMNGSARYEWGLSDKVDAFGSASIVYQSRSNSTLGELAQFSIKPYSTVDLSAGVEGADNSWRAYVWGRNVFNTYYWSGTYRVLDTVTRYMGSPATYGVTVAFDF